jgi:hypothetical protein
VLERIRTMLAPPVFTGDEEKTQYTNILNTILLAILAGCMFSLPLIVVASSYKVLYARLFTAAGLFLFVLIIIVIMRRSYVRFSGVPTVAVLWAIITLAITFCVGGVRSLGYPGYLILVIISGLSLGQRIGQSSFAHIRPEDHERSLSGLRDSLQKPRAINTSAYHNQHKNSSWRRIEGLSHNLLDEPRSYAMVVNFRDITERETALKNLRKSGIYIALCTRKRNTRRVSWI